MKNHIPDLLEKLSASPNEIRLMNVYKGVPLSFPACLAGGSSRALHVVTDPYQMVCLYIKRETFIQCDSLPETVRAKVIDLNPHQREATLSGFTRAPAGIGARTRVRVQPEKPLDGELQDEMGGNLLQGRLADISQDGLAVYLAQEFFSSWPLFPGARLTARLRLPGVSEALLPRSLPQSEAQRYDHRLERYDRENIRFTPLSGYAHGKSGTMAGVGHNLPAMGRELVILGTVVNVRPDASRSRCRIGVQIDPYDSSKPLIGRFIAQRQSEIIREIKAVLELLAQMPER
jgi:hypothetical protein